MGHRAAAAGRRPFPVPLTHLWWLAAVPLAAIAYGAGALVGRGLVATAAVACLTGIAWPASRAAAGATRS